MMLHEFLRSEASWLERLENWQGWAWGRSYPWNKRKRRGRRRLLNASHLRNLRMAPAIVRRRPIRKTG